MIQQWVRELEHMPAAALFMKRHYELVGELKKHHWQPDDGAAGFRFALLERLGDLAFWREKQLDELVAVVPRAPAFYLHNLMRLLFELGQLGLPAIKGRLEHHREVVFYQQRFNGAQVDVPLWYILLPLESRPKLFHSALTYGGEQGAKTVPPHASVRLVQVPNAARTGLVEAKVISDKFQTYNRFAYVVFRVEPLPESQLVFTNHVEQTRLSPEYTGAILEAAYEYTRGLTGLRVVLLDAVDHPIDSSAWLFKTVTQRALTKVCAPAQPPA